MSRMEDITNSLHGWREGAAAVRDLFLADLVMLGEIPAPTGHEEGRVRFIVDRFLEHGLQDCAVDEVGNGFGILAGTEGRAHILLVSNADTLLTEPKDQTIEVREDRLIGPFVGDNSIALAALTVLPHLLDRLQVRLKSNVILLASSRALGRGNQEGLKSFLANCPHILRAGFCLESVQLGRLNYACIGMLRGEITCRLPDDYNWEQYGASGTILPVSEIVNRISQIPLPRRPVTSIVMGQIRGGITHGNIARETSLGFEVRSESAAILAEWQQQVNDIVEEVGARSGTCATLDVFARREPGGLEIGHPLVRQTRAIQAALGLSPMLYPTTSQLVAIRDVGIPGVTLGLTTGERRGDLDEIEESVAIEPLATGLAQLVGVLRAVDEGLTS